MTYPPCRPRARAHANGSPLAEPASFAQQRLWLLQQLLPAGAIYNIPNGVRLRGNLNVEALRRALGEVVERHEVLRTRFVANGEGPMQVIDAACAVELDVDDLRGLAEDVEALALERAQAESELPFDLMRGPLIRARLFRLDENQHWLVLGMHHIVSDGWSMGVLWHELATLYAAFTANLPSPLPPLPVQYADYAVWQRDWLAGDVLDTQLAYWRGALENLPQLDLPTDRPRPPVASHRGARLSLEVSPTLTAALKALSRRHGATLFMTLLAAWQVLLSRYSGQDDVVVGVPIAGRTRPELEGLIGFFVNTLVLRGDLSGAPRFSEFLGRVRERALEAYAHQDLPFEKLVEALAPRRDPSRNPLFQTSFVLQNAPAHPWELPGLAVERIDDVSNDGAKFDLTLEAIERDGALTLKFRYAVELYEATTIERMAAHFERLLEAIVADPEQPVNALPLIDTAERERLVDHWNRTSVAHPHASTLTQLFEAQAERTPGAIAVASSSGELTYDTLNRRANALANRLREAGVGPEKLVGLCIERSPELVIGMLAILKAGGAYLPLDPGYPQARLAFMLEDSAAPVVLTQSALLPRLGSCTARRICIDDGASSAHAVTNPVPTATAHNLAYVIYTSGSTGRPKGVMIEQRAICNHTHWMQRRFPLGPDDRVLQKTPVSFDASVWEFFAPLTSGARLVLAGPDAHASANALVDLVVSHGVTVLQLVPSLLAVLLEHPGLGRCVSLRRVFCGGELLPAALAVRLRQQCAAELVNLYGPTEATIDAVAGRWDGAGGRGSVAIGHPIDNMRCYVLDERLEPVPVGIAGELYLAGAGLARGYLRRPDETAKRFVRASIAGGPVARAYRTGDRVRWRCDGVLEFLGRHDEQVKIRGVRIELGEIEATLATHPALSRALVTVRRDPQGEPMLVAYVVAVSNADLEPELRTFLRARLPEPMIPAAIVPLAEVPLLPNGKVDWRRLPDPASQRKAGAQVSPGNPIEERLAVLWRDLLGVERVGRTDDFFDLGGHSLAVMRMLARVTTEFGHAPGMREFFGQPTIEGVAQHLTASASGRRMQAPAIRPVARVPRTGTVNTGRG